MDNSSTRFRFTKATLEAFKPEERLYQVYDTESRALTLLVTPGGVNTFYRSGRINGQSRRVKIGMFPDISVQRAREKCAAMNNRIAEGNPLRASVTSTDPPDRWHCVSPNAVFDLPVIEKNHGSIVDHGTR